MSVLATITPQSAEARSDLNAVVDRWLSLRAMRAFTPVGYTPAKDLFADFSEWHVAEFPDDAVPAESAFSQSLRAGFKIRFEVMPVRKDHEDEEVALCVNLTLVAPLRAVA